MTPDLLYIAHGSNDFADDMHFIGLQYLMDKFNIYYSIAGSAFGKPDTPEERHIEFPWRQSWIDAAQKYRHVSENKKYDVCIIGQVWEPNQEEYMRLKHLLNPWAKLILVDSTDDGGPQIPALFRDPVYLFKNNIVEDFHNGIFLPFCCPYEVLDKENNEPLIYDINCQLGDTHPARHGTTHMVLEIAEELGIQSNCKIGLFSGYKTIIGNDERTPIDQYWKTLEQSRITIHERGCGFDAFRFWEAMATGNFVLASQNNLFQMNNTPMPENVLFWRDKQELKYLIEQIISIPEEEIIQMRARAKEFVNLYHAPHRRLEKMLNLSGTMAMCDTEVVPL